MSVRSEEAVECFSSGFNCSQAVCASCCDKFGIDKETAYKIACAFGGGMGHSGGACGAVTGALMLIGMKYGKFQEGDLESKDKTYKIAQEYMDEFKKIHGSINCTALIGFNLSKGDELLRARETGVFRSICTGLVKDSVEIVERYL